jgi:hypothetical protein
MSKNLRWTCGILALGAALIAATGSAAGAEKLLRYKFTPGETLHYVTTQEESQVVKADGSSMTTAGTITRHTSRKVESVDSQGVASVTHTFDRIQVKMKLSVGNDVEYDSAAGKPPEPRGSPMVAVLHAIVRKPFSIKIDPQGKVTEMKFPRGLQETLNEIDEENGGGFFFEDVVKAMMEGVALPTEPVVPGKTWSQEESMRVSVFGKLTEKITYRYEGSETRDGRELQKIAAKGKFGIAPEKDKPEAAQTKIKRQKAEGTLYFDKSASRIIEYNRKANGAMEITTDGKTIEYQFDVDQTIRLEPDETTPNVPGAPEKK